MTILTDVGNLIQTILGPVADSLVQSTKFIKRKRELSGSTFIKTLVFGWMQNQKHLLMN
jgi:hypothetical protein